MGDGPGDNATKAMAYDMDLSASLPPCSVNGFVQAALDQQVGTFGVKANPGEVRPIPNALEPSVQFRQRDIGHQ
jgi:hypothetical protein